MKFQILSLEITSSTHTFVLTYRSLFFYVYSHESLKKRDVPLLSVRYLQYLAFYAVSELNEPFSVPNRHVRFICPSFIECKLH